MAPFKQVSVRQGPREFIFKKEAFRGSNGCLSSLLAHFKKF